MVKESDRLAFDNLVSMCAINGRADSGIGTYKEKSLHYILKHFFESDPDFHEVAYRGFVADCMRDDQITEIQTATLYGMTDKLDAFLTDKRVRIVFPIAVKRRILWMDKNSGEVTGSLRYTKGENMYSLIWELAYIVDYLRDPSLTVTAVLIHADDYRLLSGRRANPKKGARKLDLIPTELVDVVNLSLPEDLRAYVPEELPEVFTRDDFSKAAHLRGRALWGTLKVLEAMRVITRIEPEGRRHRFIRNY